MRLSVTPVGYFAVLLLSVWLPIWVQAQTAKSANVPDPNLRTVFKVGGTVSAPRPIYMPDPEYSEEARRAKRQGSCLLRLIVGPDGNPSDVTVERSLGMGLDEKALDTVRSWKFEPARKDGKPVAVEIHAEVSFHLLKDTTKFLSPEELKIATEAQAEVRRRIYRDPEGQKPRVCREAAFADGDKVSPAPNQQVAAVRVDQGQQYRLERITFKNNTEVSNARALRTLFPIEDGDFFKQTLIDQGLANLRNAYLGLGHLDFTYVPEITVTQEGRSVALEVEVNEGKKFFVRRIDILGLDERVFQRVVKHLLVKPGDIYDQRLVSLFVQKHASLLPANAAPDSRIDLQRDERAGTVAITFDFRRCSLE